MSEATFCTIEIANRDYTTDDNLRKYQRHEASNRQHHTDVDTGKPGRVRVRLGYQSYEHRPGNIRVQRDRRQRNIQML